MRESSLYLLPFHSSSPLSKRVSSLLQQSVKTSSEVSLAVAWSNDFFVWSNMSDLSLGYEFLKAENHRMLYSEEKEGRLSNKELLKSGSSFILWHVY
jgi:hypothetical protein